MVLAVRIGIGLPRGELTSVVDYAVRAEKLGFELVSVPDHVFIGPEAIVTLAAVAGKTRDVKLATLVLDANRRNPAVLAHQTACLDHLSQGRFILGIGKGVWNELTYGFKCNAPVSRMKETADIVKLFWTGNEIDYGGRFFQLSKAKIALKPYQQPHPPVWIAIFGKRMLEIAAATGDGMITQNLPTETLRKQAQSFRDKRRKRGFDEEKGDIVYAPNPIAISRDSDLATKAIEQIARGFIFRHSERLREELGSSKAWASKEEIPGEAIRKCFVFGKPDECIAQIEEYRDAGAKWFIALTLLPEGTDGLTLFAEKVLPYFKPERS